MAETLPHRRVKVLGPALDRCLDMPAAQAAALERDRTVAGLLDKMLEQRIAQARERLRTVHGLAQGEEAGSATCVPEQPSHGRSERAGVGQGSAVDKNHLRLRSAGRGSEVGRRHVLRRYR